MIKNYSVWIGLPAFNEEDAIKDVLESIKKLQKEKIAEKLNIIVFNDGSKDNTVKNAKQFKNDLNINIIDKKENCGLGYGIFSIIKFFKKNSGINDKLILMDCDNTHDPFQILNMLNITKNKRNFVVIASRYQKESVVNNVPFFRKILSDVAYLVFNLIYKTNGVRDFTCGFRMYDKSAINNFFKSIKKKYKPSMGFEMQLELLLILRKTDTKFFESPINLDYQKKPTKSKMKIIKTILSYLNLIFFKN